MSSTDGGTPATPKGPWPQRARNAAVRAATSARSKAVDAYRRSWLATGEPTPADQVWEESKVDVKRIPVARGAHGAEIVWNILNWTERPLLYLPVLLLRLVGEHRTVQGPARWVFVRPTRRVTFYLFTFIALSWLKGVL